MPLYPAASRFHPVEHESTPPTFPHPQAPHSAPFSHPILHSNILANPVIIPVNLTLDTESIAHEVANRSPRISPSTSAMRTGMVDKCMSMSSTFSGTCHHNRIRSSVFICAASSTELREIYIFVEGEEASEVSIYSDVKGVDAASCGHVVSFGFLMWQGWYIG
jgi:hypothetical protein